MVSGSCKSIGFKSGKSFKRITFSFISFSLWGQVCKSLYFEPKTDFATSKHVLEPIPKTRKRWQKIFETALDDLTVCRQRLWDRYSAGLRERFCSS